MSMTALPGDHTLRKRIRTLAIFQVAVIVVIGALSFYLTAEIARLARARDQMRAELAAGTERIQSLRAETADLERQRAALRAEKDRLETEKAALESQIRGLQDRNLALRADVVTQGAALQILEQANPAATNRALSKAVQTPRVYIQVSTPENERIARALRQKMTSAGYLVPTVERVPSVPRKPQVRYFRPEDADDAQRLAGIVRDALPDVQVTLFGNVAQQSPMRPRHLELWF